MRIFVAMQRQSEEEKRLRARQGEGQGKAERRRRVHGLRRKVGIEASFLRLCQEGRERERQGKGQGKAERRRRVHGLWRKVGIEASFLRLCGSYSLSPSFTNLLFVCFFYDCRLAVGIFVLKFGSSRCSFLTLFCWQNDAYLVTFLVYMYPAFEEKGRYTQDKKYSNGACRSKNLQCGAFAGRPGAVGRLGQRRTRCRPWPGHGGHGSHSLHDVMMMKETCRLSSPAVGGGSPTSQVSRQGTVLLWTFSAPAFRRSMVLLFIGDEKLCCATMVGPRLSTGN